MKKKSREALLHLILKSLRFETDSGVRYNLQMIGEGLIAEYKDMKRSKTEKDIRVLLGESIPEEADPKEAEVGKLKWHKFIVHAQAAGMGTVESRAAIMYNELETFLSWIKGFKKLKSDLRFSEKRISVWIKCRYSQEWLKFVNRGLDGELRLDYSCAEKMPTTKEKKKKELV